MAFSYKDHFKIEGRTGYETLLYDVLIGDQTLFQGADQIEGGWRAVAPLIEAWREGDAPWPDLWAGKLTYAPVLVLRALVAAARLSA